MTHVKTEPVLEASTGDAAALAAYMLDPIDAPSVRLLDGPRFPTLPRWRLCVGEYPELMLGDETLRQVLRHVSAGVTRLAQEAGTDDVSPEMLARVWAERAVHAAQEDRPKVAAVLRQVAADFQSLADVGYVRAPF